MLDIANPCHKFWAQLSQAQFNPTLTRFSMVPVTNFRWYYDAYMTCISRTKTLKIKWFFPCNYTIKCVSQYYVYSPKSNVDSVEITNTTTTQEKIGLKAAFEKNLPLPRSLLMQHVTSCYLPSIYLVQENSLIRSLCSSWTHPPPFLFGHGSVNWLHPHLIWPRTRDQTETRHHEARWLTLTRHQLPPQHQPLLHCPGRNWTQDIWKKKKKKEKNGGYFTTY